MSDIFGFRGGLPPGLALPRSEEPIERFLAENFNRKGQPYEEVVELGMFAVALLCFDDQRREEGSLMPTRKDLDQLHEAGYGLQANRYHKEHGGLTQLQANLGFCPGNFAPSERFLKNRLAWVYGNVVNELEEQGEDVGALEPIFRWCQKRNLIPSRQIMTEVLGGGAPLYELIPVGQPRVRSIYTAADAYQLGSKVIKEHGRPLLNGELRKKYEAEYAVKPFALITGFFDTLTAFWAEFDRYPYANDLSPEDLVNIGVRRAIRTGKAHFDTQRVRSLSARGLFPSKEAIHNRFDGKISAFAAEVINGYEAYLELEEKLLTQGVQREVTKSVSGKFEVGAPFKQFLQDNVSILKKLSDDSDSAQYALSLIRNGLELCHQETMDDQINDLMIALKRLGLNAQERQFVYGLIPRTIPEQFAEQKSSPKIGKRITAGN